MKLSDNTIEILKNFATINMGILIRPGSKLRTCSSTKVILAEAEIDEVFEKEIGVYDLNKFLSLLNMKKGNHEVDIEDKAFAFAGFGSGKIRMRFTEPSLLVVPGNGTITDDIKVKFDINQDTLNWINNVASILRCPNIVIECDDTKSGDIILKAIDVTGAVTDDAFIKLDGKSAHLFKAVFKVENIKFIPGDYEIGIQIGALKATNKNKKLKYWLAMETKSSSFNGKPLAGK